MYNFFYLCDYFSENDEFAVLGNGKRLIFFVLRYKSYAFFALGKLLAVCFTVEREDTYLAIFECFLTVYVYYLFVQYDGHHTVT